MHAASGSEERSGKRRREKRRPRFSPIRKRGARCPWGRSLAFERRCEAGLAADGGRDIC